VVFSTPRFPVIPPDFLVFARHFEFNPLCGIIVALVEQDKQKTGGLTQSGQKSVGWGIPPVAFALFSPLPPLVILCNAPPNYFLPPETFFAVFKLPVALL